MSYRKPAFHLPAGSLLVAGREQQLSERSTAMHSHPEGQLIGSVAGLLSIGTQTDLRVMPACQAIWLPPRHRHAVRSHGPFNGWSVYVAEDACGGLPSEPRIIDFTGLLREAVLRAATWPAGPQRAEDDHVVTVLLDEIGAAPLDSFQLALPRDPRLLRIADAILADPADSRPMAAWAAFGAITERTMSRTFVAQTGLGFNTWRQHARLLRALEMLAEHKAIGTIAIDLGYSTPSAFIALFRKVFGLSPGAYSTMLPGQVALSDRPQRREQASVDAGVQRHVPKETA